MGTLTEAFGVATPTCQAFLACPENPLTAQMAVLLLSSGMFMFNELLNLPKSFNTKHVPSIN